MKCKFCNESNSIHCDDACDFHLQEYMNALLSTSTEFLVNGFGFKYVPGTDRLMIQCKSCFVYELASQIMVNEKGLFAIEEKGVSVAHLEKAGWRKINNKWHCSDCLKII